MSVFKDSVGQEWRILFDAFLLSDVAKETGVELADVSSGGWSKLERDSGLLGRVLAVLCQDEIANRKMDSRAFVRNIRGDAIEQARAAMVSEGSDFFPRSEWSAIQSNLTKRQQARDQAETIQMAMSALEGMSQEFQEGAMMAMMDAAKTGVMAGISSSYSADSESVAGPELTPLSVVTSEQERSESVPVE